MYRCDHTPPFWVVLKPCLIHLGSKLIYIPVRPYLLTFFCFILFFSSCIFLFFSTVLYSSSSYSSLLIFKLCVVLQTCILNTHWVKVHNLYILGYVEINEHHSRETVYIHQKRLYDIPTPKENIDDCIAKIVITFVICCSAINYHLLISYLLNGKINDKKRKPREMFQFGKNPPKYTTAYIVQQSNCRWHCEPTFFFG